MVLKALLLFQRNILDFALHTKFVFFYSDQFRFSFYDQRKIYQCDTENRSNKLHMLYLLTVSWWLYFKRIHKPKAPNQSCFKGAALFSWWGLQRVV